MYHISIADLGSDAVLAPRIPEKRLASENKQPRICFSPTRQGAFLALPENKSEEAIVFYVYKVVAEEMHKLSPVNPLEVLDAHISGEHVSYTEVRVRLDRVFRLDSTFGVGFPTNLGQKWGQIVEFEKEELFDKTFQNGDELGYILKTIKSERIWFKKKWRVNGTCDFIDSIDGRRERIIYNEKGVGTIPLQPGRIYFIVPKLSSKR